MNLYILIPVAIVLIALIVFLIKRNRIDEKEYENQIKEDFHDSKKAPSDIESEDPMH
jgi:hypothetical protein